MDVEDDHGVVAFAGGVDGVMDVDMALRVLAHAEGVAVLDPGGQLAPMVDDLVAVGAFAIGSGMEPPSSDVPLGAEVFYAIQRHVRPSRIFTSFWAPETKKPWLPYRLTGSWFQRV